MAYGDAFVTKFNPSGSALVYSTYLGGSGDDWATASPWTARATLTSPATDFTDFPTSGAFQRTNAGYGDAFVTKINPTGSALVYSTYLGGSGIRRQWLRHRRGQRWQRLRHRQSQLNRLSHDESLSAGLRWRPRRLRDQDQSHRLGFGLLHLSGRQWDDCGYGIAVDSAGNAYVTGSTESTDFPTTPGALQTTYGGGTTLMPS